MALSQFFRSGSKLSLTQHVTKTGKKKASVVTGCEVKGAVVTEVTEEEVAVNAETFSFTKGEKIRRLKLKFGSEVKGD